MIQSGDFLTNAVDIHVSWATYEGGIGIECSTVRQEMQFKENIEERAPQKVLVDVHDAMLLPVSFLLDARVGDFAKLHLLVNEYVLVGSSPYLPGRLIKRIRTGEVFSVSYDSEFRKTGICMLRQEKTHDHETYHSTRIDKKVVRAFFSKHPVIPIKALSFQMQYAAIKVYRDGNYLRTWIRDIVSDSMERKGRGESMGRATFDATLWVTRSFYQAPINLKLVQKV